MGLARAFRFAALTPRLPRGRVDLPVRSLGSGDGRKSFLVDPRWKQPVVVSGGVGLDLSFEIEFVSRFGANVILIDPTELAFEHFAALRSRLGEGPKRPQLKAGVVDPESYDLTQVSDKQLELVAAALWQDEHGVELFDSADGGYSLSILGLGLSRVPQSSTKRFSSVTVPQLCKARDVAQIDLLKLDIEGAALEVLESTFESAMFPSQIHVEVDELLFPSLKHRGRALSLFQLLESHDYVCVDASHGFEFLFASSPFLTACGYSP